MAGVKTLKKVESDTPDLTKIQENVSQAIAPAVKSPIIDGTLLRNIKLETGKNNDVDHKLDRNLRGWMIIRQRAEANIWDLQDSNTLSKKTLRLRCSANVTVDLWVF